MSKFIISLFLLMFPLQIGHAKDTNFIYPLACSYGQDCWAVNYVDVNPEKDVQDFQCNAKSYDGHKGTDFALGSVVQMRKGVDVLAASDGEVLRVRDGQSDHLKTPEEMDSLKSQKKECGNGVLIDHGDGLQVIYCHLKKNSIIVDIDQEVSAGEKIAQVGQSGMAEFPHLHFGVIAKDGIVDPFTGHLNTEGCGEENHPLWHSALNITYEPVAIFNGGFRTTVPDFKEIERGQGNPKTMSENSASFVFWTGFYNVEQGDQVYLKITDPNRATFTETTKTVERTRARQYYYTGRKIGNVQLIPGTYNGFSKITRTQNGEKIIRKKSFNIEITP